MNIRTNIFENTFCAFHAKEGNFPAESVFPDS